MFTTTLHHISIAFTLLFLNFQVLAATEQIKQLPCHSSENKLDNEVIQATAIKKVAPKYPINAARNNQEGWVRLSFVVKEDGSVDLPIIEDSSGIKSFEKAAKKAVKAWKFDPATRGGKTIEQCQNSVQLSFKMNKTSKGASRRFVKQYREILQLIDDKKLEEAKYALAEFEQKPRQNFYEDKFFFSLKAIYFQALGDNRQELANLRKLIPSGKDYLPKGSYVYSIARAFQLALLNNELSSNLYFYDKLKQFDADHEKIAELTPYIDKINTIINSSEHIFVAAQINERDNWNHYLARKSFTFTNIEGQLDSVDIRCDNHFSSYAIDSEKQWKIPASWGKCQLFVKGEQGAKFNLIEVAETQV
jgi:TonB family protein